MIADTPQAEAAMFFRALYSHVMTDDVLDEDVEIEIRSLRRNGNRVSAAHGYKAAGSIAELFDIISTNARQGNDIYMGVAPRIKGSPAGDTNAVRYVLAAVADVDVEKTGITYRDAMNAINSVPFGPPNIVVKSGGGIHAYWKYDEPLDINQDVPHSDPSRFDKINASNHQAVCSFIKDHINEELRGKGNADPADSIEDVTRILRIPGTMNVKRGKWVELMKLPADVFEGQSIDDMLERIPSNYEPSGVKSRVINYDALPTELPRRVVSALKGCGSDFEIRRGRGKITAVKLFPCPACKSNSGCYLSPKNGDLRTFHSESCPASGKSIPIYDWYSKFVGGKIPCDEVNDSKAHTSNALSAVFSKPMSGNFSRGVTPLGGEVR